jgi:hypothetical protein
MKNWKSSITVLDSRNIFPVSFSSIYVPVNPDQALFSFCNTELKNVSCARLFSVNNLFDSLFNSAW